MQPQCKTRVRACGKAASPASSGLAHYAMRRVSAKSRLAGDLAGLRHADVGQVAGLERAPEHLTPRCSAAWPKVAELATLPSMNPTIGAALIALIGAVAAAGGAYYGASRTAAKTIEADRHRRLWEKRSEAYTDAVAGILQLMKVRTSRMQHMTTETEPEDSSTPMDLSLMEARLIAYASDAVLEAMEQARLHGNRFDTAFRVWLAAYAKAHAVAPRPPTVDSLAARDLGDPMATAKEELPRATKLCNDLMDIIRQELYAGPGRMEPPQPRDLTKMARDDISA